LQKSLITPVCTRWNSFYDSVKCLLEFENTLNAISKAAGVVEFKQTEIEFLKEYLKRLEPVAKGLDYLQGEH